MNKLSRAIKAANQKSLLSKTALLTSSAAIALMGLTAQVNAEEAAAPDEIVVTGIRGALKNAVDIKRNSDAVVDAVSAEDVGKLPDSDVGQSLGRIPGVSVSRSFGQGASVSIRGAAPQMTLVQLDGHAVASTGWFDQLQVDRSFNYSMLPSELIGGMEVYKSSQADLVEGGVGGTVNVKTRKPLDLDANSVYVGAKASQGTISSDLAPELSGMYSWKNDGGTFGVLLSAMEANGDYVRRGVESDARWWDDVAPSTFIQYREREAANITLQAKPTDGLEFGLSAMHLHVTSDNTNSSLYLFTGPHGYTKDKNGNDLYKCLSQNSAGLCTQTEVNAYRGDLGLGWASGNPGTETFVQTWGRVSGMTSNSYDGYFTWTNDKVTVDGRLGTTKADGGTGFTFNYQFYPSNGAPMSLWGGTVDATGHQIKIHPTSNPSLSMSDLAPKTSPQGWAMAGGPNTDQEDYGQVDVKIDLDLGAIKSFKAGIRTADHTYQRRSYKGVAMADSAAYTVDTSSVFGGSYDVGPNGFTMPEPKFNAMKKLAYSSVAKMVEARPGYANLEEQNDAIYGMFTFEADALKGNFGLRYIQSDIDYQHYVFDPKVTSADIPDNIGFAADSMSTDNATYHDVLPSMNLSFDLTSDVKLRATASQTISRPNYDDMLVSYSGFMDDNDSNQTFKKGSVGLKPMKSAQADFSVEYYYGEGNMMSATYFVKSINNFVTSTVQSNVKLGMYDPKAKIDSWTVDTKYNAGGANIEGLELQWNHAFNNGFGYTVAYTYANANAPAESYADGIGTFTESSKDTLNLVGYWENETFSARAAYNWRSKYMVRDGGFWYSNRMHDSFGTLDLSLGWNVTENIKVSFEGTNLTESDDIQYGAAKASSGLKASVVDGYPAWSFAGEAMYTLGVSFKL